MFEIFLLNCLEKSKFDVSQIHAVEIGDVCRIPTLKVKGASVFNQDIRLTIKPDEVVVSDGTLHEFTINEIWSSKNRRNINFLFFGIVQDSSRVLPHFEILILGGKWNSPNWDSNQQSPSQK